MIRAYDWDSPLEVVLKQKSKNWLEEQEVLTLIHTPRHIGMELGYTTQLHVFSDASKKAYDTCVYALTETDSGEILVTLVAAKSRVSPLKVITIPSLELCTATIETRLGEHVRVVLQTDLGEELPITYWMDSLYCLYWIHPSIQGCDL